MRKAFVISFLFVFGAMWFSSCNPAETYKTELAAIDTAMLQLDSAETMFAELPTDTLSRLFKKVKDDMKLVTNKFEGEMALEQGTLFSRYRDVPNNIKHLGDLLKKVPSEVKLTRAQLNKLKEAILSGANRDAKGNVIDEGYIKKNVDIETKVAQNLVQEVASMKEKANKAFEDYETYYPQVSAVIDSLKALP